MAGAVRGDAWLCRLSFVPRCLGVSGGVGIRETQAILGLDGVVDGSGDRGQLRDDGDARPGGCSGRIGAVWAGVVGAGAVGMSC